MNGRGHTYFTENCHSVCGGATWGGPYRITGLPKLRSGQCSKSFLARNLFLWAVCPVAFFFYVNMTFPAKMPAASPPANRGVPHQTHDGTACRLLWLGARMRTVMPPARRPRRDATTGGDHAGFPGLVRGQLSRRARPCSAPRLTLHVRIVYAFHLTAA